MGARHLCGAQPLRVEPGNTGGCIGDKAGGRLASPCSPYAGASFAGWSGPGGAGGFAPCGTRTSSRMEEGGCPRGERNVPPVGRDAGIRTSSRMVARERSERAREHSERASACARVPRAYARGKIVSTSGFLVRLLYVFLCNRVAHLLMRKFASEYLGIVLVYTH